MKADVYFGESLKDYADSIINFQPICYKVKKCRGSGVYTVSISKKHNNFHEKVKRLTEFGNELMTVMKVCGERLYLKQISHVADGVGMIEINICGKQTDKTYLVVKTNK
jgi:hypothetical protein